MDSHILLFSSYAQSNSTCPPLKKCFEKSTLPLEIEPLKSRGCWKWAFVCMHTSSIWHHHFCLREKPLFGQLWSLWLLEGWKWERRWRRREKRRGGGRCLQTLTVSSWLSKTAFGAFCEAVCVCLSPSNSTFCSPVSQLRWWSAVEWSVLMWESLLWKH